MYDFYKKKGFCLQNHVPKIAVKAENSLLLLNEHNTNKNKTKLNFKIHLQLLVMNYLIRPLPNRRSKREGNLSRQIAISALAFVGG